MLHFYENCNHKLTYSLCKFMRNGTQLPCISVNSFLNSLSFKSEYRFICHLESEVISVLPLAERVFYLLNRVFYVSFCLGKIDRYDERHLLS